RADEYDRGDERQPERPAARTQEYREHPEEQHPRTQREKRGHREVGNVGEEVHQNFTRCTRWFSVSITCTRPLRSTASAHGLLSCPGRPPGEPHTPRDSPLGPNFCTRWLPYSATYRSPSGPKLTSYGYRNRPGASPSPPN